MEGKWYVLFLYDANETLFLRNDDRRVVECVCNGFFS